MRSKTKWICCLLFISLWLPFLSWGQGQVDTLISLRGAVQLSGERYPQLQARKKEMEAATAHIAEVKYIKMPTLDVGYQANLATANNLTGLFYPVGLLPMTGPPSSKNNYTPFTGSAASLLMNWQVISFGAQASQIHVAEAEANVKKRNVDEDVFQNSVQVISSYLDVVLAQMNLRIHEQNIRRTEVNLRESRVLAQSGIRPGVDTALFLCERSKAKVGGLQASRELQTTQWLLAQFLVVDQFPIPTDTALLLRLPSSTSNGDSSFNSHPLMRLAQSQVAMSYSKEQFLKKSYLPKLTVFGTAFARGTGVGADGDLKPGGGMGLSRYNYGAGFQISFPILKYGEVKRQLEVQHFLSEAAEKTLSQTGTELLTQQHISNTAFTSSISVAEETHRQLLAARYAYQAMNIRYTTRLVNLSDMVQVQYNLFEAELAERKAYWDAWKALLLQAAVTGNLQLFLNQIP